MKILHLTSHLDVGGVASYVVSLSRAFRARGYEVLVASGGGQLEAELAAREITHWRVPLQTSIEFSPQVLAASRELARRLRGHPVDLIHAHTRVGQVVADRLWKRLATPYVATWHGFFRPNLGRRLWPCTGALTIAISEPVREHLQRDLRVPPGRIRLIPHGVDATAFESPIDPTAQERLREAVCLPRDGPVVGTVARLVASKGLDLLIRALPEVRRAVPGARLLLVGDGDERAHLEWLAQRLGVPEAVHFAGALPDTRTALSLMQVVVFLPAEQEGFGLSLLEAMACGRPLVAVRRGRGTPWVLDQGGAGAVVEPGDVGALAAAIIRFLQNGELACRAAGDARAVVKERYALSRMVDQVDAVYREVVG
jgi:glycosyltransferase involved in cell wall biosynthesis